MAILVLNARTAYSKPVRVEYNTESRDYDIFVEGVPLKKGKEWVQRFLSSKTPGGEEHQRALAALDAFTPPAPI